MTYNEKITTINKIIEGMGLTYRFFMESEDFAVWQVKGRIVSENAQLVEQAGGIVHNQRKYTTISMCDVEQYLDRVRRHTIAE